jgi:carbon-monoxide dehydrogenase medium subunit
VVQYCRPQTVDEALQLLATAGGAGRLLVGGTDLLVGVRRQPLEPLVLVDLKTANDLPLAIEVRADSVRVGPTATMSSLSANPLTKSWYPALIQASRVVGSVAIRNRASLIGNICNASPAADTAPALLIYGATVTIVGPGGDRTIPLVEFFVGPGKTACGPDELVIGLELVMPHDDDRSAFQRLTRRRGVDLATVSVAAKVDQNDRITLGLGAVGPTPLLTKTSDPVDPADTDAIDQVIADLVAVATPISDVRAGQSYREAMTAVLAKRAVLAAFGDGGEATT